MDDEILLLGQGGATFKVRPQVVSSEEVATLATTLEASIPNDNTPTAMPVIQHVVHQLDIFLRWP